VDPRSDRIEPSGIVHERLMALWATPMGENGVAARPG
jgi:hypothetical protein